MKLFRKLNSRGHTHILVPLLVILVIGGIGTFIATKSLSHASSTSYVQCTRGSANGRTVYTCGWSLPTPVRYSNNTSAGSFYRGSRNYIFCQKQGLKVSRGSYYNTWWGYTLSDQNHYGWANAVYTTSGSNNYGFAYASGSSWVRVPTCSTGTPPGGSASTPPPPPPAPKPGSSGYLSPFRSSWHRSERIDQGVDFGGSGNVYAMASGKILHTYDSGWPGGTYIVYELLSGPAAGKRVFVAEDCSPKVSIGQVVSENTVLCYATGGSNGIEMGWSMPSSGPIGEAAAYNWYHSGVSCHGNGAVSAYGQNFNSLLVSLGVPSGNRQSGCSVESLSALPSSWPRW